MSGQTMLDQNWTKIDAGLCWQDETPLQSTDEHWLACSTCGRSYKPSPDRAERIPVPKSMRGRSVTYSAELLVLESGEVVPGDGRVMPPNAVAFECRYSDGSSVTA